MCPDIYIDWDEVIDPVLNSDFLVDFTDPARPDVIFRVGSDTWRVWSENSGDPSALGDLTCPYADNFTIAVMNSSGGVGATSVESIILDPTNDVNYSSLGGANITGNVNGGISLQNPSGKSDLLLVYVFHIKYCASKSRIHFIGRNKIREMRQIGGRGSSFVFVVRSSDDGKTANYIVLIMHESYSE